MKGKNFLGKLVKTFGIPRLLLIMAAGIVLVLLSVGDYTGGKKYDENSEKKTDKKNVQTYTDEDISESTKNDRDYAAILQAEAENVLSQVSGVGRIKVMLTLESTAEKVVLRDNPYQTENQSETDGGGGTRNTETYKSEQKTVCISEDGDSIPYVVKEIEPRVKGVAVAAEGADDINIKKEIIEAIQVLFGIEVHKIKVMKLK